MKYKLLINKIIFVFLFMGIYSCVSPEPEPGPVPFTVLDNFRLQNIDFNASVDSLSGVELIITNQNDYEKYLIFSEQVEVNFDEDFVLAGISTVQPHCVYVKEQSLQLLSNTLQYTVTIGDMDCTMPERAKYGIVISRNYVDYPVEFIVEKDD